ncbi:unnamed protein product, partial [Rotaria sp. Silwood2]
SIIKTKTSKNDLLSFSSGDSIEVCEGELINLQGIIIDINGDSIRVLPKHEAFKDEILLKANEIRKYFSIGNHVKVLNVRFEGATGMIVGIDGVKAIVLSDETKDEVKTSTSVYSTEQFQLKDLANIPSDKVGIVIRIERERLQVLNMNGKVQIIPIQSNHHGQIKHIYRNFVFIFCCTLTENSGLFVSKARNLLLTSDQSKVSSSLHLNSPVSYDRRTSNSTEGIKIPFSILDNIRRDTNLIGQTVRISQGSYKGHVGIVKDATVSTFKIELHTKCQTTPHHDGSMTPYAHDDASA